MVPGGGGATVADVIEAWAGLPLAWRLGAGALLGAIIGSYLATLALRWPRGEPASRGRSRCDGCGRALGWADLVPLASYVMRRGRCRVCGAQIDPVHPLTELAAALIGGLSLALYPGVNGFAGAIFGWVLLLLATLDIRHFWLPDRVTLPLVGLGLGSAWLTGTPSLADALIGAAAGFLLLVAINIAYRALRGRDGLGGGDSKLLAAIGAWLGWPMLPFVLLLASATGLLAAVAARLRGVSIRATDRLPFGAFLAVAAWPLWLARDALATFLHLL
ncbi:prepilin peptidase [Parasphingopyxis algicola]|uniref:prepilin peptidase n=1 Tax=Parasphingopyxis algicola TaxID=2026624 RepID=UPI0015A382A5|nr:A24 family peptidase [Parasphingopyxis algicola]QLC23879.1 prepilin peptidase [Parasphingopyxis algicola]